MSTMTNAKSRPWLATAAVAVVAAVALLVIPIPYDRVTGHEVTLTLGGASFAPEKVPAIAKQLKSLLHAGGVRVEATANSDRVDFVFTASVPASTKINASATATAFAAELQKMGYTASATTRVTKERVSGTLYAYAYDRVIEISMDGKSAQQLESEIRQKLTEAGATDPQVSVTDLGGEKRKVEVNVQHKNDGSQPEPGMVIPELVLTKGGAPVAGHGVTVRIEKRKSSSGTMLTIHVTKEGQSTDVEIPNADGMPDAALAAAVQAQLDQAGIKVKVTVTDGHISVETPDGK